MPQTNLVWVSGCGFNDRDLIRWQAKRNTWWWSRNVRQKVMIIIIRSLSLINWSNWIPFGMIICMRKIQTINIYVCMYVIWKFRECELIIYKLKIAKNRNMNLRARTYPRMWVEEWRLKRRRDAMTIALRWINFNKLSIFGRSINPTDGQRRFTYLYYAAILAAIGVILATTTSCSTKQEFGAFFPSTHYYN